MQQNFPRQGSASQQGSGNGGRWDAIIAERQMSSYSTGNGNNYQRGSSGNYNNRNTRGDNYHNSGGYGGQRDNNYHRREHDPHKPFHSHVGEQSGDATGADWNTPLTPNANIER